MHLQTRQRFTLIQCVLSIYQSQGIRGFYSGISAPLFGSMIENAVLFISYNAIQIQMRKHLLDNENATLSRKHLLVAGGLAGTIVSFVITPFELLKCRIQTQGYILGQKGSNQHSGPLSVLFHVLKKDGIHGLYSGHVGTMLREGVGGVAWFGSYELCVDWMIKRVPNATSKADLRSCDLLVAGAIAGMSYNAAFFPADVIKSRIQSGMHPNESFLTAAGSIYNKYGLNGFFRGFNLTVLRSAPSSGIIFLTYVFPS